MSDDVWTRFEPLHGPDHPQWARDDLRAAIHRRGVAYAEITQEHLGALYDEEQREDR